jgi:predicted TIM-barrel fold metal-dependent hydrolase
MPTPLITLEEHFLSKAVADGNNDKYAMQLKHIPGVEDKLRDLDMMRLADMAAGKVSLQVISHAPGAINLLQAKGANDQLAAAIRQHPDRFAGFAVLPMAEPTAAAEELRRCVTELGFKGALIDNHTTDGKYYDGVEYDTVWQVVEGLGVPVYLHPTWATEAQMQTLYQGEFSEAAARGIASSAFGWHSDVASHFLRLYAAGVFERYSKLKIILGHFGEMLPFMLERICALSKRWGTYKRPFKQVWDENVWVTTSGVWSLDPMVALLRNTKIERILYSVDYPFATNERGLQWWEELSASQLLSREDLEKIAYRNAEGLMGLKAQILDG